jgi:conjugal transfer pilin signal peptidase TrbI
MLTPPNDTIAPLSGVEALDRLLNAALVFLLLYAVMTWFSHRFVLGFDQQSELCLLGHHRWYLIDRAATPKASGDLLAFRSDSRMAPELKPGTMVVKRVEGLATDRIELMPHGVRIEGLITPVNYPHRERLQDRANPNGAYWILPEGHYWVMGDHVRSFDSRYFGPVQPQQVLGVAYALPF